MSALHNFGYTQTEHYEGHLYSVEGKTVVLCSDGTMRAYEAGTVIRDPVVTQKVKQAVEKDTVERARRVRRAAELSQGDAVMASVWERHLAYSHGIEGEPLVVGPHLLWPVGRNAGGEFYIGVTDGQRVVFYGDEGAFDEGTGMPLESCVHAVDQWGYLGHG